MYREIKSSHNWLIKKSINDCVKAELPRFLGIVVDLGCGSRPFEEDILRYASNYIGVDWSNTLHTLQAEIVADLNEPLPIPSESADHIVSFEVMEHLREPAIMLSEAFRILRTGGTITASAPFQWWLHEAPWDYYRYTCYGHQYLFEKAGFVDINVQATTGFWTTWFLKFNYQSTRLIRGSRWRRVLVRAMLVPIWWMNQQLARVLDRQWKAEEETAGYFVTARKP